MMELLTQCANVDMIIAAKSEKGYGRASAQQNKEGSAAENHWAHGAPVATRAAGYRGSRGRVVYVLYLAERTTISFAKHTNHTCTFPQTHSYAPWAYTPPYNQTGRHPGRALRATERSWGGMP